jgi:four helix bundle protein
MKQENNLILNKTFAFAEQLIYLHLKFKEEKEFVISKQFLRSGTSIGANVEEAIAAQSRKDFIAKMTIANKEARETRYWLRLLDKTQIVKMDYDFLLKEIASIINILTAIVKTSQEVSN